MPDILKKFFFANQFLPFFLLSTLILCFTDSVSSDVSLTVTALPRNVPFFGMKDVEDILQRLVNVRNIEDARPLKIKHYLQVSVSLTNSLEFSL